MAAKVKLSITLSSDIVRRLDRTVGRRGGTTRSEVIEDLVRRGERARAVEQLEADTITYYASLTDRERDEDRALGEALTRAAAEVDIDAPPRRRRRR